MEVEYTVFGTRTGTSYFHQDKLLPLVLQAGVFKPSLPVTVDSRLSFYAERRLGVFLTYVFRPTQREYS